MPELNEFAKASVNGIPLILVVIGLVEYAKRLGAQDRGLLVVSMGTGLVLGAGYQLAVLAPDAVPTSALGW